MLEFRTAALFVERLNESFVQQKCSSIPVFEIRNISDWSNKALLLMILWLFLASFLLFFGHFKLLFLHFNW